MTERRDQASVERQALLALRTMRLRLEEVEQARTEPIAIVGIGCRFPGGATDPDAFWHLLRDGVDAITEVPADRWDVDAFYDADPATPGKMYSRWGGFVRHLDRFDPEFFGISPREAEGLDPQQRLLLEVAWEALERGGQSADKLAGSPTGVFVGIGSADFSHRHAAAMGGLVDAHFGTGIAPSVAAGRLAYFLGLHGPCLAIDTACSSSLVAVHLACQSLRNRECRAALAGGVNVMLWPELTVAACKARMLAHDGRCKTFDDAADGYVRGEGCGVIVLKRLSDAVADRDSILAVIRGTAVNQDGHSGGLTVPNGPAQQAVIEQALRNAGVQPRDISYVEAHGTGTSLGDPIELRALGDALGIERAAADPLVVGSVKTNIGHLEAAAGIASLIKVVLALTHGELPPHLHLHTRNRHVDWATLPIAISDRRVPWQPSGRRRIAGVSSFGFSGTNAHAILEQAPAVATTSTTCERPSHVLALSAKTQPALVQLARTYAASLADPAMPIADACFTANAGRAHFNHRLALIGENAEDFRRELSAFAAAPDKATTYRESAPASASESEVVFVFSGRGAPRRGIGRSLYETQPAFRSALEHCDRLLAKETGASLLSVLYGGELAAASPADRPCADVAVFALEYSLASMWQSWGIKPAAVVGDGVGRDVAACVSGTIDLADALATVARRARPAASDAGALQQETERLHAQGFGCFLEIGPDDWPELLSSLRELYLRGVRVDWEGFDREYTRHKVALPTYPFQRERCWVDGASPSVPPSGDSLAHPLLGTRLQSPLAAGVFEARIGLDRAPYLADHRVNGGAIAPASVFVELGLAAAARLDANGRAIHDLTIEESLALPDHGARIVQTIVVDDGCGNLRFEVHSKAGTADRDEWVRHATGSLQPRDRAERPAVDLRQRRSLGADIPTDAFYAELHARGLQIGTACRGIVALRRGLHEAFGEIAVPESARGDDGYWIHPVLLDACCHVGGAAFPPSRPGDPLYLLIGISRFDLVHPPGARVFCHATIDGRDLANAEAVTGSMRLFDETGRFVAVADGLTFKRVRQDAARRVSPEFGDWLYELAWRPKPLDADVSAPADFLVSAPEIAAAIAAGPVSAAAQAVAAEGSAWLETLESLSTTYVMRAFADLGWHAEAGQHVSVAALAAQLRVRSQHTRLLERMLAMLEEDGVLARSGDGWTVVRAVGDSKPQVDNASLGADHPSAAAEFRLLARCGERLASVLRGEVDPLQLLFPGGSSDELTYLYRDSPRARVVNERVQQVVHAAIARRPDGRKLRVLEVGGGTGSATASILPILPSAQAEYVFTDVAPLLVERAAQTFGAFSFAQFRRFDVERSPESQGFDRQRFDIIVAANVIHATRNLHDTVAHLRRLLAPAGLLVLVEATQAHRWLDLTFGLTDGWWRFEDRDIRRSHALLTVDGWASLLSTKGFAAVNAVQAYVGLGGSSSQSVIAATNGARPTDAAAALERRGAWLVFADTDGIAVEAARRLKDVGYQPIIVRPGSAYRDADEHVVIDPLDRGHFDRLLRDVATQGRPLAGILHVWSADRMDLVEAERLGCGTLLYIVQALAESGHIAPIWLATRGAQAVVRSDLGSVEAAAHASLWGFARGVAVEHPELWGGIVDLDPDGTPADAAARLVAELTTSDGEDQLAFRGGDRVVVRLQRNRDVSAKPVALKADAAYLVTGGMGGLGLRIGEWMASRGARHITLLGRRGLAEASDAQRRAIQAIEALGATVDVVAADVSSTEEMRAVLARYGASRPPLRGIVHAAADISADRLRCMARERLTAALRPKVVGTCVLDALTADAALDFFVLFSSTTGLLGSADLAHYAAANTFLDAFAHYRRRVGRPVISICWGAWDRMRAASDERFEEVARGGLQPMPSSRALAALGELLAPERAQVIVMSADWSTLKPLYETKRRRPMLEQLDEAPRGPRAAAARGEQAELLRRLEAAAVHERETMLRAHIRAAAGRVLRIDPGRLDVHRGLFDLGMDSLMSVELKNRLETALGRSLPASLTFNHPSVEALTRYLGDDVLGWRAAAPVEASDAQPQPPSAAGRDDLADDDLSEDELARLLMSKLETLS